MTRVHPRAGPPRRHTDRPRRRDARLPPRRGDLRRLRLDRLGRSSVRDPAGALLNPYGSTSSRRATPRAACSNQPARATFSVTPSPRQPRLKKLPNDSAAVGSCYVGQANRAVQPQLQERRPDLRVRLRPRREREILAARPGTVVASRRACPTTRPAAHETTSRSNTTSTIRRKNCPDQDQGPGGGLIKTVAVYGQGRDGSVSAAFGRAHGAVPRGSIVGTKCKSGMPIIDAGCTGISFHDHLHILVRSGPVSGGGTATRYRRVLRCRTRAARQPDKIELDLGDVRRLSSVRLFVAVRSPPSRSRSGAGARTTGRARSRGLGRGWARAGGGRREVVLSSRDGADVALADPASLVRLRGRQPGRRLGGAVRAVHRTSPGRRGGWPPSPARSWLRSRPTRATSS